MAREEFCTPHLVPALWKGVHDVARQAFALGADCVSQRGELLVLGVRDNPFSFVFGGYCKEKQKFLKTRVCNRLFYTKDILRINKAFEGWITI